MIITMIELKTLKTMVILIKDKIMDFNLVKIIIKGVKGIILSSETKMMNLISSVHMMKETIIIKKISLMIEFKKIKTIIDQNQTNEKMIIMISCLLKNQLRIKTLAIVFQIIKNHYLRVQQEKFMKSSHLTIPFCYRRDRMLFQKMLMLWIKLKILMRQSSILKR